MDSDIDIDLSQFHEVFFEECAEGVAVMEAELLGLDVVEPDIKVIDTIFRAVHSIKGSAGTFGFPEISAFTHGMETVLDAMRAAKLQTSQQIVSTLLASVDCLREMIDCSQNSKPFDDAIAKELTVELEQIIASPVAQTTVADHSADKEQAQTTDGSVAEDKWHISFYPNQNLFFTGNDPYRLIRELQGMGDLAIQADISKLPDFSEIDVESCYLGWDLILNTSASLEEIKEVFAWVEGDCTLSITNDDDRRVKSDRRSQEEVKKSGRRQTDSAVRVKQELTSIRVSTDKVDNLLNLVGELVITQSMLTRVISDLNVSEAEKLDETLEILERNTRDLQEHTMSIRMLPIDVAFQRLPRVVHDLSQLLGKKVEIKLFGESTELDKTVLEKIGDPLVHMVRNALDHGLESPEVRIAAGKPETGTIKVSAHHLGSSIVVEIEDDGAGINTEKVLKKAIERGLVAEGDNPGDAEIHNMIFQPGFSTANEVSDISGRGVGMDVVKRNITDLGGTVELQSKTNVGSRVTIRLPLTLAILDGQMVRVADQVYIVPLHSIIETLQVETERIKGIAQQAELYQYRDEYIPVIRLCSLFNLDCDEASSGQALLVVIDLGGRRVGLYVNDVIGQQQVVIKSLESNYKHVEGLAGATVLGDGSVALILDVVGLSQQASCMNIEETVC